jgi:23S rRNA pseudouridine2605 synthase
MNLDRLEVDRRIISAAGKIYLMLNKPCGLVVTSSDEKGRETVYDCLLGEKFPWLAPMGRLDKASEGLLLLTNDNRWAADILDPQTHVEKTYHVQIDRIADENLILLRQFAKSPLFPLCQRGKLLSPSLAAGP